MARQIFETGVSVNAGNKEIKLYAKYIDIKVDYEQRRKWCPFWVETILERELNITAQQFTGNRNGYTIQCTSEEMSNKAIEMKNLMWLACTAQAHKIFNRSKGLVWHLATCHLIAPHCIRATSAPFPSTSL